MMWPARLERVAKYSPMFALAVVLLGLVY